MTGIYADTTAIVTGGEITQDSIKLPIDDLDTALAAHIAEQDIPCIANVDMTDRDLVYIRNISSAMTAYKLDADVATASNVSRLVGYVVRSGSVLAGATVYVRVAGIVTGFTGLTIASPVYASTTAGVYTQTSPTLVSNGAQRLLSMFGHAISATSIWLRPERVMLFGQRATLRNGGTLTITHPVEGAYARRVWANIRAMTNVPILTISEEYYTRVVDIKTPLSSAITAFNTATGTLVNYGVGNIAGTHTIRAQSFQLATNTSRITSIAIEFGANVGTPYGTVKLHLMSVNSQSASAGPNSVLWQSTSFTPTASSVNTITLADCPVLQPGYYAWALVPDNLQQSGNYWQIKGTASDTYASGISAAQTNLGSWLTDSAIDYWSTITPTNIKGRDALAQSFSVSANANLNSVRFKAAKVGSPTGTVVAKIYSDSASTPGSELSASLPLSIASMNIPIPGTGYRAATNWIEFVFPTPYALVSGTTYWMVIESTASSSSTDYVAFAMSTSSVYAGGLAKYLRTSWFTEAGDIVMELLDAGVDAIPQPANVGEWLPMVSQPTVEVKYDSTSTTTFRSNLDGNYDISCFVEL